MTQRPISSNYHALDDLILKAIGLTAASEARTSPSYKPPRRRRSRKAPLDSEKAVCSESDQAFPTEPFSYRPLDLPEQSIRLVQVAFRAKETPETPIRCSLRHGTTNDNYSCLSYVWGKELTGHQVSVNGRVLQVARRSMASHVFPKSRSRSRPYLGIRAYCPK